MRVMSTKRRNPSRTARSTIGVAIAPSGTIHQRLRPTSATSFGSLSTGTHAARLPMKIIAPRPTSAASTTTKPKSRLPFQIEVRSVKLTR
jgi:hypothetical protein